MSRPYTKLSYVTKDHKLKLKENKRNQDQTLPKKQIEVRVKRT